MKYNRCIIPGCEKNYIPARAGNSKMCPEHYSMLQFFTWAVGNIKMNIPQNQKERITKSGIILPR